MFISGQFWFEGKKKNDSLSMFCNLPQEFAVACINCRLICHTQISVEYSRILEMLLSISLLRHLVSKGEDKLEAGIYLWRKTKTNYMQIRKLHDK